MAGRYAGLQADGAGALISKIGHRKAKYEILYGYDVETVNLYMNSW